MSDVSDVSRGASSLLSASPPLLTLLSLPPLPLLSQREAEDTMDEDSSGYGYDDEMAESGFTDGEENQIEDELDFDDDDINFQSQELKPKSKSYQVDFKVHSVESIVNKQKEEIEHVSAFLQLKVSQKRGWS